MNAGDIHRGGRDAAFAALTRELRIPDLAGLGLRLGARPGRMMRAPSRPAAIGAAAAAVVASTVLAWELVDRFGPGDVAMVTIVHLPILLAAALFGVRGGVLAAAMATALLASPWTPRLYPSPTSEVIAGVTNVLFGLGSGVLLSQLQAHRGALNTALGRLELTYGRTLVLMAHAIELRDLDTAGHSERVAVNARLLGEALGVSAEDVERLYWAGLLHDIGKIAVPESILHKAEALGPDEWPVMQTHVSVGQQLIEQTSEDFAHIATAVGAHHERWDGTGYPLGRAGAAIPLLGRILAVADVFEALTCPRPYRPALTCAEAIGIIRAGAGSHFEPRVVQAFEHVLASGRIVMAG